MTAAAIASAPLAAGASSPENALRAPMPAAWSYTPAAEQTLPTDDAWWKAFSDPTLDSLLTLGENNNFDLAMAARRVEEARQAVRTARAAYFPTVQATARWRRERSGGVTDGGYSLGANASWEIDLFGRVRSSVRQSKAALEATRAQRTAAMISLCAEIATTYFDLRTAQTQMKLAEEHIGREKHVVDITQARHDAGLESSLDVAQARTVLYSIEATVPQLNTQIAADINALATLCGLYAADIAPLLENGAAVQPDCRRIVAAGVPAELLRRRPDVVEAEASVAEAAASLGLARKQYLPVLALTGSIGTEAARPSGLFGHGSLTWSLAPTLSWTVFDGLAREAGVASAREEMEARIDNYNATVHNAVQEVENALTAYSNDMRRIAILEQAVEQSGIALERSLDRYKQGLSAFINVVDAQMSYIEYTNSIVSARGDALVALATLYRALGGGNTD
ncbi:MAG: efflux transporter outer membrane subunit [Muribaculaceae bacterium]|nr:efflux transporter outer membrane subunit [Muribaculaceae bacterium]